MIFSIGKFRLPSCECFSFGTNGNSRREAMSDDMTLDDLTVVGIDGIRRSFDEHYDTVMCVEQDPTGAHHAIYNQHALIEELNAKLAKAVEALQFYRSAVNLRIDCEITHAMQEAHANAEAFIAKINGVQP